MNNVLYLSLVQIAKISILLNPIIPTASTKVLNALNIKDNLQNLSFLDGDNILGDKIKIKKLTISKRIIT